MGAVSAVQKEHSAEMGQVDEVKDIRDRARAIEMYARQAQNTEAERQACEIRLRAERKCGQLTEEMVTAQGARTDLTSDHEGTKLAALEAAGISKKQAFQWERVAAIPEADFEADLADPMWRPTTSGLLERQDARERGPLPALKGDEVFDWDATKVRNTAMEADRKSRRRDFRKSSRSRLLGLVPARRWFFPAVGRSSRKMPSRPSGPRVRRSLAGPAQEYIPPGGHITEKTGRLCPANGTKAQGRRTDKLLPSSGKRLFVHTVVYHRSNAKSVVECWSTLGVS